MQQQLSPVVSVGAGYYRNWYGNFRVTDNLEVSPEDYDPYCITAPTDTRLPGGGGYQVCGLYDVTPTKYGLASNLVAHAANYGKQPRVNNFVNFGFNTQFRSGVRFGGGVDLGRTVADSCFVVDSPQQLLNCRVVTPFKGQTQIKLNGSYPLPWDTVVSAVFQNVSGPEITASYAATAAEILPSLKRPLAGGARTATVPLVEPGTMFEGRRTQLDLRLSKIFTVNRVRVTANLDLYNALNTSDVLALVTTYGARWQQPTSILDGRLVQLGLQVGF
jgi:hypothetical protein